MKANAPTSVDEYIATFPASTQKLLQSLRDVIQKNAPAAEEYIGYQMPAYRLSGALVYFAGYAKHIGFYPSGSGISEFKEDILKFKNSKGAVQFPLDKPLPTALIAKIVKFRVKQNTEKAVLKIAKSQPDFFALLSTPAQRALEEAGIKTLKKLSSFTEKEILALHGVGPSALPKLKASLKAAGLKFKG